MGCFPCQIFQSYGAMKNYALEAICKLINFDQAADASTRLWICPNRLFEPSDAVANRPVDNPTHTECLTARPGERWREAMLCTQWGGLLIENWDPNDCV